MKLIEIDREIEKIAGMLAEAEGESNKEKEKKWRSYIAVIRQLEAEEIGLIFLLLYRRHGHPSKPASPPVPE